MDSPDEHPTFAEPSADIVVCASDNVHFKLHKIILALASDFFKDMFSLPQPTEPSSGPSQNFSDPSGVDGLPIVHVTEPSAVLERLFRLCYPMDDPPLGDLNSITSTLEAALKYDMKEATKIMQRRLMEYADIAPLSVYAVACRLSLEEVAASAANETFLQGMQLEYTKELETIPAGAYHRLLYYCSVDCNVPIGHTFHRAALGPSTLSNIFGNLQLRIKDTQDPKRPSIPDYLDREDADVVIVCSDETRLRLFKNIIQLSSPVLASKLAASLLPSNVYELSLPEPGRVLSILFQTCYPVDSPTLTDIHDIYSVFVAAAKYQMSKAMAFARDALSQLAGDPAVDPVLLYLAACRLRLRALATLAAQRSAGRHIARELIFKIDAFDASAGDLWRLLDHHQRAKDAARHVVANTLWLAPEWRTRLRSRCGRGLLARPYACWHEPYVAGLARREWPRPEHARDLELLNAVVHAHPPRQAAVVCEHCADPAGVLLLVEFSEYLADTLDARAKGTYLEWRDLPGETATATAKPATSATNTATDAADSTAAATTPATNATTAVVIALATATP